jgi:hypothetical protein
MSKNIRIFLGGTCNESAWREDLICLFDRQIGYFNPVVDDWTPDCAKEEISQKRVCDYCLYVITPEMTGVYSIAEVVQDSIKSPEGTIFCILNTGNGYSEFDEGQLRSLNAVKRMVVTNGARYFDSLVDIAEFFNSLVGTYRG